MYLILRHKNEGDKGELCFVQAVSATDAKKMVGVPDSHSEWGILSTELVAALASAKEGYFVVGF